MLLETHAEQSRAYRRPVGKIERLTGFGADRFLKFSALLLINGLFQQRNRKSNLSRRRDNLKQVSVRAGESRAQYLVAPDESLQTGLKSWNIECAREPHARSHVQGGIPGGHCFEEPESALRFARRQRAGFFAPYIDQSSHGGSRLGREGQLGRASCSVDLATGCPQRTSSDARI